MPKKGDDLDAITTAVVMDHLSNAVAVINTEPFDVIFDREGVIVGDTIVTEPSFLFPTDYVEGLTKDDEITINNTLFTYAYQLPDGTGMSRVVLKDA